MKHTPGPWRIEDRSFDRGRGRRRYVVDSRGGFDVCQNRIGGRAEYDAALIAAAPDLLAACREMLATEDYADARWPVGDMLGTMWPRKYAALRAAIAKAEGGAE